MSSVNSWLGIGRLVRDPELRKTPSDISVTNFTLAVDRSRPDGNGEFHVDFIDCVAWRKNAEKVCEKYKKGDLIAVEGELQVRTWTDKDGKNHASAEILVSSLRKLASPSGRVPEAPAAEMTELPADSECPFDVEENES